MHADNHFILHPHLVQDTERKKSLHQYGALSHVDQVLGVDVFTELGDVGNDDSYEEIDHGDCTK